MKDLASRSTAAAAPDRLAMLQTFVRIVEAGSLSAAAARLGATQPTVSRRLQALERSLGLRLLQRSTHAMKLTEDGERCFERAKALLASWDAFEAELRGDDEDPEGTLRVVAPHAFGQQQLVGPLADYLRRHPRVTVEWLLHDRPPDFIAQRIDCAIHVGEVSDPSVVALRLGEVPRIVVVDPALLPDPARPPADPGALRGLPWLAFSSFYRTEVALTHRASGRSERFPIQPRLSTDSLFALRSAALCGLGACVASAWALGDDLAAGRLVHVAPQWQAAPLPMYMVYPYARFYPSRLRRFVQAIRQAMPGIAGAASSDSGEPPTALQ